MRALLSPFLCLFALLTFHVPAAVAADGLIFTYKDPNGRNPETRISITPGYVIFESGPGEQMIADLQARDILMNEPGQGLLSMKAMRQQFFPNGAPASGTGGLDNLGLADVDGDLAVMFEGLPAQIQGQLKTTFAKIPRAQAIPMINQMRAQFGLSPVDPGAALATSKAPQPTTPVETGKIQKIGGFDTREITLAGDSVWITDPSGIEGGNLFVDQMSEFARVFDEVAAGMPIPDNSLFNFDKIGGFPVLVVSDGEQFQFQGVKHGAINLPN